MNETKNKGKQLVVINGVIYRQLKSKERTPKKKRSVASQKRLEFVCKRLRQLYKSLVDAWERKSGTDVKYQWN